MENNLRSVVALLVGVLSFGGMSLDPNIVQAGKVAYVALAESPSLPLLNLVSGEGHTCALQVNATVQCAGLGEEGQLGSGTPYWFPGDDTYVRPTSFNPMVVMADAEATAPLDNVRQIGAGAFHTCAVKFDGTVWCWGRGNSGQIGDGVSRDAWHGAFWAVVVSGLPSAVYVVGGERSSCAIDTSADVWCWGRGTNVPVRQSGVSNALSLSMGDDWVCALLADRRVQCWEVGGSPGDPIPGLTDVVQVSRGHKHTCALKSDGTVWCWGYTGHGQVGNGADIYSQAVWFIQSPVQVVALSDVVSLSSSIWHTCAVLSDATVKCWGYNEAGGLGDRTTESRSTPVSVLGLSNVVTVHNGRVYSCAITSEGKIMCWGRNEHAQFNNANLVSSLVPVLTPGYGEELPTLDAPQVSGTVSVGETLTAVVDEPVSSLDYLARQVDFRTQAKRVMATTTLTTQYQWYRNAVPIHNATSAAYALSAADAGSRITVRVKYLKHRYVSATRTSGAVFVPGTAGFSSVPPPQITGTAQVGQKLIAATSNATPAQTSFTYAWRRLGSSSVIGTKSTYLLTSADVGNVITVVVTAHKNRYTSTASSPSLSTPTVLDVFTKVPKPVILGIARVGQELSASAMQSTPVQDSFDYEWKYKGTNIVIGSTSTYVITPQDLGKRIVLVVVANKAGFATRKSLESVATKVVVAAR